jgi:hypothetical protein
MTEIFTQNDVLRFIYNDLSIDEKQQVSNAILLDMSLMDFYQKTLEAKSYMECSTKEPSEHTVLNILNYSKTFMMNYS